jgi:RNA polymerase sigma-70 factor, ECF subfamily
MTGRVDVDLSGSLEAVDMGRPRPQVLALEDAVRDLRAPLVRRLALIVGDINEAEDLAQATFAKAVESWASFDGRDVRAWLFTIGIRQALDEVRRRRRHSRLSFLHREVPVEPSTEFELWDALRGLEPAHRVALLLNVVEGYTQAEVAELLDVPSGTVASWISRAKATVRRTLREGEADG